MSDLRSQLEQHLAGRYILERELGGGGMSRVFLAQETQLGRRVVLKVLPPEMSGMSLDRFRREIQLAASLQHPHIVPVHSAGDADGIVFFTMPYVEGQSLRSVLASGRVVPVADALRMLRDVADALAYAHARGVVHRDVKPDNVLMSGDHAVVTDFGVAKALTAANRTSGEHDTGSVTGAGVAIGTPAYMAPEQAAGDPDTDHRADIYAFGLLAWELLVGKSPFAHRVTPQEMILAQLREQPEHVAERRADLPEPLAELVMRCLEKRPGDRPQSAVEVRTWLEAILTPRTSGGAGVPVTHGVRPRRRAPALAASAIAFILLVAGAAWWPRSHATLDHDRVAVVPFRVTSADASLRYLREGMLDLFAAKLTGEGGPRSADPRAVLGAWRRLAGSDSGELSREEVLSLAERIGAGQVLLGDVSGTTAALTVTASVIDVHDGRQLLHASVTGPADSLARLVDRLTAQLLAERAGEGARLSALTSTSLPALRAYLAGQSLYRHGRYQEAGAEFGRAVAQDSTFALAALGMIMSANWYGDAAAWDRGAALAWAHRDRLSSRDRALLESNIGPEPPRMPSFAEQFTAKVRYRDLAPERADAWFEYGDALLHFGAAMGIEGAAAQAADAFRRAVAIDSSFVPALEHLAIVSSSAGDTAAARRYLALYLAADSAGESARGIRWRVAMATGDQRTALAMRAAAPTAGGTSSSTMTWIPLQEGFDVDSAHALLRRIGEREVAEGQYASFIMLHDVELLRGRPRRALEFLQEYERRAVPAPRERLRDALATEADTAAAAEAMRALAADFDAPMPAVPAQVAPWGTTQCLAGLWSVVQRGDTARYRRTVERLGAVASSDVHPNARQYAAACALLVDAVGAAATRAPDARQRAAAADSMLRTGTAPNLMEIGNPIIARVWERLGEPRRALDALRRRSYFSGRLTTLASSRREEGRLAAATGDVQGAVAAWRHYLALRNAPEPSLAREVEGVRQELARLERQAGGR